MLRACGSTVVEVWLPDLDSGTVNKNNGKNKSA